MQLFRDFPRRVRLPVLFGTVIGFLVGAAVAALMISGPVPVEPPSKQVVDDRLVTRMPNMMRNSCDYSWGTDEVRPSK